MDEDEAGATLGVLFPAQTRAMPSTDALTDLARKRAADPSIFDEHDPIFWRAQISNGNLDAYFTRMGKSSLQNYAADAERGISFQDAHQTRGLQYTLGRSLAGNFIAGKAARVEADFFSLPGLPGEDGARIDGFLAKMRAGIVSDVSIGFHGGQWICSICGRDMMDWSDWDNMCWHIPGVYYNPDDGKKAKSGDKGRVLCTATIEGANGSEASGVYDGATPDASIVAVKARQQAEAGRLAPETQQLLEARYRIHLPAARRVYAPGATPHQEGDDMGHEGDEGARARAAQDVDERNQRDWDGLRDVLARTFADAGMELPEAEEMLPQIPRLGAEIKRLREIESESEGLKAQASDGRAYRAKLVEDVLAEGVRAFADFDAKDEEGELKDLSIKSLEKRLARYASIAVRSGQFPAGRKSSDLAHDPPDGKQVDRPVSIAAYRV